MDDAPKVLRLSARDAVESLTAANSPVQFSPLSGVAAVIVDLDGAKRLRGDTLVVVRERLRELPCPSIALRSVASRHPLEGDFDVLARSEEEVAAVALGVEAVPLASSALVQLLRHSEKTSIHEALIAESFVYSMLQSGPELASWLARQASRKRESTKADEPAVKLARDGPRLDIVLNRPARHNAYSVEMRDGLVEALEVAVADDTIEEIVLSGEGPSFCAGGDLAEFGTRPDPVTAHAVRSVRNAARLLSHCRNHVRAEVQGACVGAGAELAAFATFVVAKSDAFFELPEVGMGLVPGAGGTASIPRRIGRQRTAYLALTGARIDAKTALEWRLVDSVVAS